MPLSSTILLCLILLYTAFILSYQFFLFVFIRFTYVIASSIPPFFVEPEQPSLYLIISLHVLFRKTSLYLYYRKPLCHRQVKEHGFRDV